MREAREQEVPRRPQGQPDPSTNEHGCELFLRYRMLRGFAALEHLHKELYSRASREGYANRQAPLSKAVLLDPAILKSDAFPSAADKEAVLGWKDGGLEDTASTR